ncbi:MAG: caspase family protein [Bacteroidota bacterium]
MYFNAILPVIFTLLPLFGISQMVEKDWQITLPTNGRDNSMHRMIQSINGELVVVGQTMYKDGETNGFLVFLDAYLGGINRKVQIYGRSDGKDDVIVDVVQLEDGGFYLLCNSTAKKMPTQSRLIRTDEAGRQLESIALEEGRLQRMLYLGNDRMLLLGKKEDQDGKIWLLEYDARKIVSQRFIGEGKYADLKGVAVTPDREILLCGTTRKVKKEISEGAIWLAKINQKGFLLKQDIIDTPDRYFFQNASTSFDGNLLLAGGQDKNWMMEVDHQLNPFINEDIAFAEPERSDGVIRNYTDQHLFFSLSFYQEQNRATYLRGLSPQGNFNVTESGKQFDLNNLLYSFEEQYIVGGNTNINKNKGIKIVSLRESKRVGDIVHNSNGTKGVAEALVNKAVQITNIRLQDDNRNGILERNERAAIIFDLKNTGNVALTGLKVKVNPKSSLSNIKYFDESFVSYLAVGDSRSVPIPFNAGQGLAKGEVLELVVEIRENTTVLESFPFTVSTGDIGGTVIIDWDNIGDRTIRAEDGSTQLRLKIHTDRKLKAEDIAAHVNGVVLEDQKQGKGKLEKSGISKFYTFTQNIVLDTGENVIYYEIIGADFSAKTDTIHIFYQPDRPNLHVLAIGPSYDDLQYTRQDAQDFANAMRAQAGKNFYNKVFVKELILEAQTDSREIEAAFEGLAKQYWRKRGEDKIAYNDVLVVFISSHGRVIEDDYKIIPYGFDDDRNISTSVDYKDEILDYLNRINCKKLLFIDACHSGSAKAGNADAAMTKELLRLNKSAPGLSSISSCGAEELSYEDSRWENGAFTEAFLEALKNKEVTLKSGETIYADQSADGLLSLEEIYRFLRIRVPDLVEEKWDNGRSQHPIMNRKELEKGINFFVVNPEE